MKKSIIRVNGLFILVCLAVIVLLSSEKKVYATEQQPYLIKINRACNTVTVYEKGIDGDYNEPLKAMVCSVGVGARTITGTFQTKGTYRWKALNGNVWGQYATRIVGGILFHSVYYYQNGNPASLATKEFNKLGTAASHGCIRLSVSDAKWIYDHCGYGTKVIIYDNKDNPGPLGKPEPIRIASSVRWDPTDPSDKNPYKDKMPKISGAKNLVLDWGETIDLLKGVKATSSVGTDITSMIKVKGEVNTYLPGEYKITYTVTDALGRKGTRTIIVTQKEPLEPPELRGIKDKVTGEETVLDEKFALEGVEAYRADIKLDQKMITVTMEEIDQDNYKVIYQIIVEGEVAAIAQAAIYIDREPPEIIGVKDLYLDDGEVLLEDDALYGITATDNYSEDEDIILSATLTETQEGNYEICYQATDEAGNIASVKARANYY